MPTFSVSEIIGKTLIAKVRTPVYSDASDTAQPTGYVNAGQPIGTVYSWLNPKAGRTELWWLFYDSDQQPYYTPHKSGQFDISALQAQGAITSEEKTEAAKAEAETITQKVEKYGKYILVGIFTLGAFSIIIKNRK